MVKVSEEIRQAMLQVTCASLEATNFYIEKKQSELDGLRDHAAYLEKRIAELLPPPEDE